MREAFGDPGGEARRVPQLVEVRAVGDATLGRESGLKSVEQEGMHSGWLVKILLAKWSSTDWSLVPASPALTFTTRASVQS